MQTMEDVPNNLTTSTTRNGYKTAPAAPPVAIAPSETTWTAGPSTLRWAPAA